MQSVKYWMHRLTHCPESRKKNVVKHEHLDGLQQKLATATNINTMVEIH
jgi:hypothetical protein